MPHATASPCRKRVYPVSASSAWPKVWPKFRMRRRSPSRSSLETTSAFMRTLSAMMWSTASGLARQHVGAVIPSGSGRASGSRMMPALMISYSPARYSRSGSVSSTAGSMSTASGWWKLPIRFLPLTRLTPVLPPMAASTCASSVVGICSTGMPRMKMAARKPRHVVDDAAAEGDHHAGAVGAALHHLLGQRFHVRQALAGLRRRAGAALR